MANKSLNVFTYNDYRQFLSDYFAHRRKQMSSFSIRNFAQRAGISSHSYISAILNGKRNLTPDFRDKFAKGIGLQNNELDFFKVLVDFTHSKASEEKQKLFEQLNGIRRNTTYYELNKAHFYYFSKWYHFVVRELVVCVPWHDNYALLASFVLPVIGEAEARAAVKVLCGAGLVLRKDDGCWVHADEYITTVKIPGHLIKTVRKQFIELSVNASETIDPTLRELGSATLTLSKKNFAKAIEILQQARQNIIALSRDTDPVHRVYQAHLHLFPLSKEIDSREGVQ